MKILICGDRKWSDTKAIEKLLNELPPETEIIQGCAPGADSIAAVLGELRGFKVHSFPAKWDLYGKAAGPIRNNLMLDQKPEKVFAFHNDFENSRGTKHCVTEAIKRGIPIEIRKSASEQSS